MKKSIYLSPLVVKIVVPLAAIGIGFILSWMTARYYVDGAFVNWTYLGTPPTPLQSFRSAMFDESVTQASIVIETKNELFYRGSPSLCTLADNCWEKVDFIPENIPSGQFHVSRTCPGNYDRRDDPPGKVVSCATYEDVAAGTHFVRDVHFAMLDDGTIWTWQFVPGMGAWLIILAGAMISILVAGVFLAIFIIFDYIIIGRGST